MGDAAEAAMRHPTPGRSCSGSACRLSLSPVSLRLRIRTMYVPAHFAEDRIPVLHDAIRACGLATLVSLTADGLIASHVPLLLDPEKGPFGTLIGHLARPNPQGKEAIG